MSDPSATLEDGAYIQRAYTLAEEASERGDGPFGALIVQGREILGQARNGTHTHGDVTRHAERQVIARVWADYRDRLPEATLYASTEPCVMCAGAIHQAGIRRVVFGVPAAEFHAVAGRPAPALSLRELVERGGWGLEVIGPVMSDDGLRIHLEHRSAAEAE